MNQYLALDCLLKRTLHQLTLAILQHDICMDMPNEFRANFFLIWFCLFRECNTVSEYRSAGVFHAGLSITIGVEISSFDTPERLKTVAVAAL